MGSLREHRGIVAEVAGRAGGENPGVSDFAVRCGNLRRCSHVGPKATTSRYGLISRMTDQLRLSNPLTPLEIPAVVCLVRVLRDSAFNALARISQRASMHPRTRQVALVMTLSVR
jgi:hypothetical protein